ncbi:Aminotransferase-like, plant mobile domain family protein [Prunus dulcis]|uniref:Aminotransferase-like, plant mobile domain family protein n=1 Tax=Prunus dulcis TaxID=3755 RepID=A0A4Y1RR04_PRUDU|nr:Aminotransferase-like, plant mobile domain family protein [Prunus dulcis]
MEALDIEALDMEAPVLALAPVPAPAPHTPHEPLNNLVRWPITEELREALTRIDVLLITGMPIDGRPYSNNPVRPDEDGWAHYLRAYIMYVIGSYLIPDDCTGLVSAQYLGLLDNLQEVGSYAWGAAAWASLYNSLDRGIVNGLAYALMVFAIEHIKPLRIELIGETVDLPMECPLMVSWSHLLHKRLKANTVPKFGVYMQILGNVTDENFIQRPYQRLSHTLLREGYERYALQLAKACSVTLCINYHIVVPHKPNNYARQFGFENIDLDSIPELPDVVVEVRKKGPKKDLNLADHGHFPCTLTAGLAAGLVGPPYAVELLALDAPDVPVQALHDNPPQSPHNGLCLPLMMESH